mmetsp:Transcript_11594/g.20597  ORF Transcript_11594/g.20597 Transcript_11594/m.20597 type:complete len:374 (+) Transcript_11594:1797-2918(+)
MRAFFAMAAIACWLGIVEAVAEDLDAYLQKSWELSKILPRPLGPEMCWYAGVDVEVCARSKRENLQRVSGRIPDGFLAGYTQAGSTYLWDLMRQHPGIYDSCKHHTEYHYLDLFVTNDNVDNLTDANVKGVKSVPLHLGEYMSCLDPNDDNRLAINYDPRLVYADTGIPATIYTINPDTKIVLLFRSPKTRIVSRMSFEPGRVSCRLMMGERSVCYDRNLESYVETMLNHMAQEKACEGSNSLANPMLAYKCTFNRRSTILKNMDTIVSSLVGHHAQHWLNIFPRSQFLMLKSEDLYANPKETLSRVFDFFDLAPFQVDLNISHNSHVAAATEAEDAPLVMTDKAIGLLKAYLCESYRLLYNLTEIRWDDWEC